MKYYYLLLLLIMTACSSGAEVTTEENIQNTQTETGETISDVDEPISELERGESDTDVSTLDSLVVPAFAIHLDFSEKVQKILDSGQESLIVDIILSGQPTDRAALAGKDYYSDEDEIVYLKNLEIVYKQNETQTLTFPNLKISKEALNTLTDPNYMVAIGFYSSRTSSENNVFYTDGLMENVNTIKGKTHSVKIEML